MRSISDGKIKTVLQYFTSGVGLKVLTLVFPFLQAKLFIDIFGDKNYAILLVGVQIFLQSGFVDFGISSRLINKVSRFHRTKFHEIILKQAFFRLFLVVPLFSMVFFGIYFSVFQIQGLDRNLIGSFYIFFVMHSIFICASRIRLAKNEGIKQNLYDTSLKLFPFIFVFLLSFFTRKAELLFFTYFFTVLLVEFNNFFDLFKNISLKLSIGSINFIRETKKIFMEGKIFFMIQVLHLALFAIDLPIIKDYFNEKQVISYSVNKIYFDMIVVVGALLSAPIWPIFGSLIGNLNEKTLFFNKYAKIFVSVTGIFSILIFITHSFFLPIIARTVAIDEIEVLIIFLTSFIFAYYSALTSIFFGLNMQNFLLRIMFFSAIVVIPMKILMLNYFKNYYLVLLSTFLIIFLMVIFQVYEIKKVLLNPTKENK